MKYGFLALVILAAIPTSLSNEVAVDVAQPAAMKPATRTDTAPGMRGIFTHHLSTTHGRQLSRPSHGLGIGESGAR